MASDKQFIPRVSPDMMRHLPDQFCDIINRLIDAVNKGNSNGGNES